MTIESISYQGRTYRRYPESKRWSDRAYFKRSPGLLLHVEMYKAEVGPIPPGHEVHHRDFDTSNNTVDNFQLVTKEEHKRLHSQRLRERALAHPEWIEKAREAAKEWHRSEAGREWHRQHAKTSINVAPPRDYTCEQCGKPFTSTKGSNTRFCSNKCKSAWRRQAGIDDETRTCLACGQTFTCGKYERKRCCSRVCGQTHRRNLARQEHDRAVAALA